MPHRRQPEEPTMRTRRHFITQVAACATLAGLLPGRAAGAGDDDTAAAARTLRRPLEPAVAPAALLQELVRCATLAANGHNTQPWKFGLSADRISIRPDPARRTPAVDPDDHHVWTSLGCATENLVIAAAALGRHAAVTLDGQTVQVALEAAAPVPSPLVDAIFQRQCSRASYDAQPLSNEDLNALQGAADRAGVQLLLLTDRAKIEGVTEAVTRGNSAQMRDAAFVQELKDWIRFNASQALATGDGLYAAASGSPTAPPWLGRLMFSLFFSEKSENEKYAAQLRSSAGVAVFVGARADPASWFEVGRAYERFALTATQRGVRSAFVNQPIEVPAVRTQFAQWLGLGQQRPDLVVRFGHGPQLPFSLRRPVAQVID
jgi:hypothetical protein